MRAGHTPRVDRFAVAKKEGSEGNLGSLQRRVSKALRSDHWFPCFKGNYVPFALPPRVFSISINSGVKQIYPPELLNPEETHPFTPSIPFSLT